MSRHVVLWLTRDEMNRVYRTADKHTQTILQQGIRRAANAAAFDADVVQLRAIDGGKNT